MPPRRRLRVVCSSDEEEYSPPPEAEEDYSNHIVIDDIETDFQTVGLNSANPTPISNNSTASATTRHPEPIPPLDISDDDGNGGGDSNNSTGVHNISSVSSNSFLGVSESPVSRVLENLGLRLRREWLDSCLHGLSGMVPGFLGLDDATKAKLCFEQFLSCDLNYCGAGVLPPNVQSLHLVDLKGPFVLQVDEIVNIGCPLRGRYENAVAGVKRCLKLSMTDGIQRVFGMEYRPIKDLEVFAPAGLKVAICNVNVRHGLLMLVPEVFQVLGGMVEELEAARQRLVNEVNKPPRGKRTKNGAGAPLATRATRTAWPTEGVNVAVHNGNSRMATAAPSQLNTQGSGRSTAANVRTPEESDVPVYGNNSFSAGSAPNVPANGMARESAVPMELNTTRSSGTAPSIPSSGNTRENTAAPAGRDNSSPLEVAPSIPIVCGTEMETSVGGNDPEPIISGVAMDVEDSPTVDELEHPFLFSEGKEIPFTYLASLSAKWAAMEDKTTPIQGNVKCFLTGVKGFQFKQRETYELQVYVDDGSLISEILVDHNVVKQAIGYSPEEVTSALASSDTKRVSNMKEALKLFQMFLVNFEGLMLVQMNASSAVPVAIEMSQGCPVSDAWLLLERLQPLMHTRPRSSYSDPIDISP